MVCSLCCSTTKFLTVFWICYLFMHCFLCLKVVFSFCLLRKWLAVQGTLKSLLQHHSLKASVLQCSAFFMVQLLYPYMTTGKPIDLTRQNFVSKVVSLLLNMLSGFVRAFLPRSKHLLILWLQLPSAVILETIK